MYCTLYFSHKNTPIDIYMILRTTVDSAYGFRKLNRAAPGTPTVGHRSPDWAGGQHLQTTRRHALPCRHATSNASGSSLTYVHHPANIFPPPLDFPWQPRRDITLTGVWNIAYIDLAPRVLLLRLEEFEQQLVVGARRSGVVIKATRPEAAGARCVGSHVSAAIVLLTLARCRSDSGVFVCGDHLSSCSCHRARMERVVRKLSNDRPWVCII